MSCRPVRSRRRPPGTRSSRHPPPPSAATAAPGRGSQAASSSSSAGGPARSTAGMHRPGWPADGSLRGARPVHHAADRRLDRQRGRPRGARRRPGAAPRRPGRRRHRGAGRLGRCPCPPQAPRAGRRGTRRGTSPSGSPGAAEPGRPGTVTRLTAFPVSRAWQAPAPPQEGGIGPGVRPPGPRPRAVDLFSLWNVRLFRGRRERWPGRRNRYD